MTLFNTAIDLAAARRLTRLIVKDKITEPLREHSALENHEKLSYLVHCPYCVSIYTSGIVVASRMLFPRASRFLLKALALAEIQATLTELEDQRSALVQDYGPPL